MLLHNKMKVEDLAAAGLTKTETSIYLALVKIGSSSVVNIAKQLGMDRTSVYHTLNNLERKGLVNYVIKNNKKYYGASDPENLLGPIKAKEEFVKSIIEKIRELEKESRPEQEVKVYEGKEGIRVLYTEILKSNNMLSYGASGKSFDILKYEMPHIIKKAIKQKFVGRVITSSRFRNHEMTKIPNIKFKYLDTVETFSTTSIFGGNIAINVFSEQPLLIIIKNKEISRSYKEYFETLWKIAER